MKIRLDDASAHQKVVALLTAHYQVTHLQQNVFFDGAQQELSSKNMVLRLRFYNGDERCVVSLKGKAVIIDGISRGSEVEEDIDVARARACVCNPSQLVGSDCKLLQQVIREYKCEKFLCLGGFRNVRNVYNWEGVQLELDETHYEYGTTYEIECETSDPERFRQLLGELLDKNRITYRYSTISKFGIFMAGRIGALD